MNTGLLRYAVGTVLTVYGIETRKSSLALSSAKDVVGTVLTVYGIETASSAFLKLPTTSWNSAYRLRY